MTLLLKYWQTAVIGALLVVVFAACHARDSAIRDKARAEVLYRQADSTLKAVKPQLARTDTLVIRDTVRVRVAIDRVVTLRDTLLERLTDTMIVREYIARTDTALAACSELSRDCAAYRLFAQRTIAALETKVAAAPAFVARSCVTPSFVSGVIGAVVGAGVTYTLTPKR